MMSAEGPLSRRIREAYEGELNVSQSELTTEGDELEFEGPYRVVDPRLIGYSYVSYVFINSGEDLEDGFGAPVDIFDYEERALMLGSALGDYDFIHRRVDKNTYRHATFTVKAINDEHGDMGFIRNAETYPIFTIGRWHGQDVDQGRMTDPGMNPLSEYESELLYSLIRHPEKNKADILENAEDRIKSNHKVSIFSSEKISDFRDNFQTEMEAVDDINRLEENYTLGKSIELNVSDIEKLDKSHVLVGLSVKPGIEVSGDEFDLPHEKVMDNLKEFDEWDIPYIVSGVGKSWGDILIELHIDKIEDMEQKAEELRAVDGVSTTKTLAITNTSFNKLFVPEHPENMLP